MRMKSIFVILGLALLSCGRNPMITPVPPGPKAWVMQALKASNTQPTTASVQIEQNGLTFVSPQSQPGELVVVKNSKLLQGDFTITANYSDLSTPVKGTTIYMFVSSGTQSGFEVPFVVGGMANASGVEDAFAAKLSSTFTDPTALSALTQSLKSSGLITIQRQNKKIIVTVKPDGEDPTMNLAEDYSDAPLQLGFVFGNFDPSSSTGAASSVKISNFQVTGGGGSVISDDFSTNTLE